MFKALSRIGLILAAIALPCWMTTIARADDTKAEKPAKADDTKGAKESKDSKDSKDAKGAKDEADEKGKGPTTKKGDSKDLTKAVTAINKEFDAFVKDSVKNPLRAEANYFKDNPLDVPADDVLGILEKPAKGDNRAQAYVKWQLTTLLPEKLDAKQEGRLLKAYQKSPQPVPVPGASPSPQDQQKLNGQLARLGKNQEFKFNDEFIQTVDKAKSADGPVVAYRTVLFHKLPPSIDLYKQALNDSYERLSAGLDFEPFLAEVTSGIKVWATGDAKPKEVAEIQNILTKASAAPAPVIYTGVKANDHGYDWLKSSATLNDGQHLTMLSTDLEKEKGKPPVGGEHEAKQKGKKE